MPERHDEVLICLRRIIRATDLQSRRLGKQTGLTTPQLVVLRSIRNAPSSTVGAVAIDVSLSQATVTTILNRLQARGLVRRTRGKTDRRRVRLHLTPKGSRLLDRAPAPLQEEFIEQFSALPDWEQHTIIASLARVADMMGAGALDAAPLLASGAPEMA